MYFEYDDINLYYEKYGNSKKSIIILPGWGETRNTFQYMINFLKNYFTVYIVDYPGFGNTKFPNHNMTIYDYSNLIHEWINDLELTDPILIGHSFGARIINVLLGYYHYNFSNVILMNAAGIKPKKTLGSILRAKSYKILKRMSRIIPKRYRKKYLELLFSKYASNDYKNLPDDMKKTFQNVVNEDLTVYLSNIKTRTLLIWGDRDDSTPLKDAYTMKKLIKDSELIVIKGTDHFTYLQQPRLINSIIYEQIKDEI